jgi:hypothetical protein
MTGEPSPGRPKVDPALGGPLWVTPPSARAGDVRVATDALLAHGERLGRLAEGLRHDTHELLHTPLPPAAFLAGAPPAARHSVVGVEASRLAARAATALADDAAAALRSAIAGYTRAETAEDARMLELGRALAVLLGPALRALVVAAIPTLVAARALGPPPPAAVARLREWLLDHPELITSPAFVEGVRAGVMSLDDGVGAAAGLPPGVLESIAAAAGYPGVRAGAALVAAGGRPFGFFTETAVQANAVARVPVASGPVGAVERLARVPEVQQVRIERYEAPGQPPRFVVYVGPTETFSPVADHEPWDLTSNVAGVVGMPAGSLRATELAMHLEGIQPTDAVQFVGFSQGGLVATLLAADSSWNAVGLATYGAPAGGIALPDGISGIAVRNSDDFIPALAGPQVDHHLLQVERQAFAPGTDLPTGLAAPAHQRNAYVATATVIDQASSGAVRDELAALDAFTGDYTTQPGATITATTFHAERDAPKVLSGASSGGSTR